MCKVEKISKEKSGKIGGLTVTKVIDDGRVRSGSHKPGTKLSSARTAERLLNSDDLNGSGTGVNCRCGNAETRVSEASSFTAWQKTSLLGALSTPNSALRGT